MQNIMLFGQRDLGAAGNSSQSQKLLDKHFDEALQLLGKWYEKGMHDDALGIYNTVVLLPCSSLFVFLYTFLLLFTSCFDSVFLWFFVCWLTFVRSLLGV